MDVGNGNAQQFRGSRRVDQNGLAHGEPRGCERTTLCPIRFASSIPVPAASHTRGFDGETKKTRQQVAAITTREFRQADLRCWNASFSPQGILKDAPLVELGGSLRNCEPTLKYTTYFSKVK